MTCLFRRFALAAALSGAVFAACAQASLPEVQRSGDVEYVTGGVGLDESTALKAAARQWPLALQFAVTGGGSAQYASDIGVVMRGADGRTVLEAVSGGPFLLVRVPPGRYAVEATRNGQTQRRQLTVRQGASTGAMFGWRVDAVDGGAK